MKLLTSLNWVAGVMLLVAALFWPWLEGSFSNSEFEQVEMTVSALTKAEQNHRSIHEENVFFGNSSRDMKNGFQKLGVAIPANMNFLYEVFRDVDGSVVVRGHASPGHIMNDAFPPRAYSIRILQDGLVEPGNWSSEG